MVTLMNTRSIFLALVVGMTSCLALADDDDDFSDIRLLVQQGDIYPLQKILDKYLPLYKARLLDLEVEKEEGNVIYELELLLPDKQVIELKIDAENGHLLHQEKDD